MSFTRDFDIATNSAGVHCNKHKAEWKPFFHDFKKLKDIATSQETLQ